jgi:hypothetical protein
VDDEQAWTDLAEEAGKLRDALASRAVIEQAKGIVMLLERCDADTAFAVLSRLSQEHDVPVRDLAWAAVTLATVDGARHVELDPVQVVPAAALLERWGTQLVPAAGASGS